MPCLCFQHSKSLPPSPVHTYVNFISCQLYTAYNYLKNEAQLSNFPY